MTVQTLAWPREGALPQVNYKREVNVDPPSLCPAASESWPRSSSCHQLLPDGGTVPAAGPLLVPQLSRPQPLRLCRCPLFGRLLVIHLRPRPSPPPGPTPFVPLPSSALPASAPQAVQARQAPRRAGRRHALLALRPPRPTPRTRAQDVTGEARAAVGP